MAKRFGVMIDMSRNAVMRPDELKEYIKTLKAIGYNMVELYTEDTYEVEGEPYFGYLRGRYSVEEMKDIVAYAESIGVEMIPCIQTLAHLNCIFKWEKYAAMRDTGDILLVDDERTYALIENMFKTLRKCYTTSLIHVGMDEAHMLGLGKYLDTHGYENRFDILKRHLERVIELANKYGFRPTIWSDMFFRLANKGNYYDWSNITSEVVAACPDGVDLVYWDYYHNDKAFYDGMLDAHKSFGGESWFAGGCWTWMGYAPFNTFSFDAMEKAMRSCRERSVENIMMTLWGDNGGECSKYAILPALFRVRRAYDGVYDEETVRREFLELVGEDIDNMTALELPNMVAGNDPHSPSSMVKANLFSDPLFGFLDVTVKDGVGEEYRRHTEVLLECAKESKRFAYLYETEAALTSVLEIKYDLGLRTRRAYEADDVDALRALISEYEECARRVEVFHEKLSYQWHKENKPNGFEVQDHRMGGLAMRLRSAARRMMAYIEGEIATLPELEEKLLPYAMALNKCYAINGTPGTDGIPGYDKTKYSVTVNCFD